MSKKKKFTGNIVYSTNPNFIPEEEISEEVETIKPNQQNLKVFLDKKARAGKAVTLVTGFIGTDNDLNELGKILKTKCGVGGTVKNYEILVQGDFRQKIKQILEDKGYKVKISGL